MRVSQIENELQNQISTQEFIKFYQELRNKYHTLQVFSNFYDLILQLHNKDNNYELKDKTILALIGEYQKEENLKYLSTYLLILFKPGLDALFYNFYSRAKKFSVDEIDLYFTLRQFLLEQVKEYNLEDKIRVAYRIIYRVENNIRDFIRKECYEYKVKKLIDLQSLSLHSFNELQFLLDELINQKIIDKTDGYIIIETRIKGKKLKQLTELNFSYVALRQRRNRAEKRVKKYLLNKSLN